MQFDLRLLRNDDSHIQEFLKAIYMDYTKQNSAFYSFGFMLCSVKVHLFKQTFTDILTIYFGPEVV